MTEEHDPVRKLAPGQRHSTSAKRTDGRTGAGTPQLIHSHPLIEQILDQHRDRGSGDPRGWAGYRGHVYRVFNLARALAPDSDDRDDKLAVAAAFHDIDAIRSLNYLGPSIHTMTAWLRRTNRDAWAEELAVVVAHHHRLTRWRGRYAELTEAFRRADLNEVSQGLIRSGLSPGHVREVRRSISVGVFFTRTVPAAIARHALHHPLDPLPFLRARRALRENRYGNYRR